MSAELDYVADAWGFLFDCVLEMAVDSSAVTLMEAEIVSKIMNSHF